MSRSSPTRERDREALYDKARGALAGVVVGDVLGGPWEGSDPHETASRGLLDAAARSSSISDDTDMTVALGKSIVRRRDVDREDIRGEFVRAYDPEHGYGPGTRRIFESWAHGLSIDEALTIGGERPTNGGAMRVSPVGIAFCRRYARVDALARVTAGITHSDLEAQDCAAIAALTVAAALRDGDPLGVARRFARAAGVRRALDRTEEEVTGHGLDPLRLATVTGNSYLARESVVLAVVVASRASSFREAIEVVVRAGGDTDTTGAIAGAVAGARFGLSGIPPDWRELVDIVAGNDAEVVRLADALIELAVGASN